MSEWHEHPKLKGKFGAPDYPDDLQVVIHDGHPSISGRGPELAWVRVTSVDEGVFKGNLLNKPTHLLSVTEGAEILFIVPEGGDHPVQVSMQYLAQRNTWRLIRIGISSCV